MSMDLADILALPRLREQTEQLFGNSWIVLLWQGPGNLVTRGSGNITLPINYRLFAQDALDLLNRELGDGGRWGMGWSEPAPDPAAPDVLIPQRMDAMWRHPAGDVPFMVGNADPIPKHIRAGIHDWAKLCEQAQVAYKLHMNSVGVRDSQTIKAAQGQRSVAPGVVPDA